MYNIKSLSLVILLFGFSLNLTIPAFAENSKISLEQLFSMIEEAVNQETINKTQAQSQIASSEKTKLNEKKIKKLLYEQLNEELLNEIIDKLFCSQNKTPHQPLQETRENEDIYSTTTEN